MLANHMAQYHIFNMRIYTPSSYSWDGAIAYTSLSDELLILLSTDLGTNTNFQKL